MVATGVSTAYPEFVTIKGDKKFFEELAAICKDLIDGKSLGEDITTGKTTIYLVKVDEFNLKL